VSLRQSFRHRKATLTTTSFPTTVALVREPPKHCLVVKPVEHVVEVSLLCHAWYNWAVCFVFSTSRQQPTR